VLSLVLAVSTIAPTSTIKVFVVSYFPVKTDPVAGVIIDQDVTKDVGGTYKELKAKTEKLTLEARQLLEEGSRFRGYKDASAVPALRYEVVGSTEFKEALPVRPKVGNDPPLPDYNAIMNRIDAKELVESKGVQQVWLWGYHGPNGLWESNMSSPTGDVSNSDRDANDLPVFKKTYTVFHYNYGRGVGEMLENHMHQLEHLLNWADGRDITPPEKWADLLFWGKFVGSDASHKIVTKPARCGWTHYAPNSESDYDWTNPRFVETDIEDWRPDGFGKTQRMNADRWDRDPIKWRVYWLQAIPGLNHGLSYQGKKLRNWWSFVADWDTARSKKWTLTESNSAEGLVKFLRNPGGKPFQRQELSGSLTKSPFWIAPPVPLESFIQIFKFP
jgi:hypothetical protein